MRVEPRGDRRLAKRLILWASLIDFEPDLSLCLPLSGVRKNYGSSFKIDVPSVKVPQGDQGFNTFRIRMDVFIAWLSYWTGSSNSEMPLYVIGYNINEHSSLVDIYFNFVGLSLLTITHISDCNTPEVPENAYFRTPRAIRIHCEHKFSQKSKLITTSDCRNPF